MAGQLFNYAKICDSILDAVGGTPLVRLDRLAKEEGLECELLAKCEYYNAGGSIKDRIAKEMLFKGLEENIIKPGDTIIEPTSGNTGIGLALCSALLGFKSITVIPEKMSKEKIEVLKALGSKIVRTPTEAPHDSPESHISVSDKLNKDIPGSWIPNQYDNQNNWKAHYYTTGEELLIQCDSKIDVFVCGAGTGGTITGTSKKLKEKIPNLKVIGVDPYGSLLSHPDKPIPPEYNKPYLIEGLGYDFVPLALDYSVIDDWIKVGDKESFEMARKLISLEGILCGGSSGTNVYAAVQIAKKLNLKKGQRIVVILPDSIRNYMTKHLDEDWLVYNNMKEPDYSHLGNTKAGGRPDPALSVLALDNKLCPLIDKSEPIMSALSLFSSNGLSHLVVINKAKPAEPLFTLTKEILLKAVCDGVPHSGKVSDLSKYVAGDPVLAQPAVLPYNTLLSDAIAKIKEGKYAIVQPKIVSKEYPSLRIITDSDVINFVSKYKVDLCCGTPCSPLHPQAAPVFSTPDSQK